MPVHMLNDTFANQFNIFNEGKPECDFFGVFLCSELHVFVPYFEVGWIILDWTVNS